MNCSVLSFLTEGNVDMAARSPVISPPAIVFRTALSSLSAKLTRPVFPSSSPLFLKAPDQAKIVATELVDVYSPLRCL